MSPSESSPRRDFLARSTAVVSAAAVGSFLSPAPAAASPADMRRSASVLAPDHAFGMAPFPYDHSWLDRLAMPIKQVFDVPSDGNGQVFRYVRNYYRAQIDGYATPAADVKAVLVVHGIAVLSLVTDAFWVKYELAALRNAAPESKGVKVPADRNPFLAGGTGESALVGAEYSIEGLQAKGAQFVACHNATKWAAGVVAGARKADPATVLAELEHGFAPGVVIVPAAVAAIQRAQHAGCAYVYAGE